ncbi:MAG: type II secretion system F family protein [Bacilli bacterium]|nr:type II secretion system F family protein [Bacilli bacterium]
MKLVKKIFVSIYNIFIFIITLPFNIFKYLNLGFYYIIKLLLRESPEKKKQREEKEKKRREQLAKEKKQAEEYIRQNQNEELKFSKYGGNNEQVIHRDKKLTRKEAREEHRIARDKIRREKLRQKEEERRQHKSILEQLKSRSFFAVRQQRKLDEKRKTLSLDVNGEDAKRSVEKIIFRYIAKNPKGKIEKGMFQGYSKLDVHSYLLSEGYEVYEIKAQAKATIFNTDLGLNKPIKKSALIFYLTQLSTYLKAGIPVVEAIKILSNQAKKKIEQTIWKSVVYELTMGSTLSDAMLRCGNNVFPKLLINMVKTAEMTGNLPEVLDEQVDYYKQTEKSRKEMVNAMMYPIFVFIFAIAIVFYIMLYVIPQFVSIYETIGTDLPWITQAIISMSVFLKANILIIVLIIALIVVLFTIAYKRSVIFKARVQSLLMHIPVMGQIIIYNEVNMFTKTFATLINNNIFITDSMDILGRITENEIYKGIIYDAVDSLSKGETLSTAFNEQWAFPDIAYQMIVTGERTGQLGTMMEKVSEYYQEEHYNAIARVKALIEPVMIIFLAVIVGGILLAIIIPMFSMYNDIV